MKRPRVKPEHLAHRLDNGSVRIGGELYGISAEIADPNGWAWSALQLMDGEHSPEEIEAQVGALHPGLGAAGARRLVNALIDSGYVEDASAGPHTPPPAAAARYSRNHAYFRRVDLRPRNDPWEAQLALGRARVLVIGLGGTGSHAAWALAAAGVGLLTCVDADVVEESNLTRQVLYTESDIGRPKAEAAVGRLAAVNSAGTYTALKCHVDSPEELETLLRGCDALALCADEPRVDVLAHWANEVCSRLRVPWVSAGYNGPLVAVGTYGPDGPCYLCVAAGEEARLKPGAHPRMGGKGVLAPVAGISGQLIAYEVIALLTGIGREPLGYVRGMNLIAPDQLVHVRHPARPDCAVCAR
ncbi:HesA/MoeB/ThiF family protein [Streptomyces sp. NPDC004126]|uniref:HesA/MoeB/ThiF family protein n=1 Tax=Streptomyces sp. NPDC004126 TaxID=3390695 RepID=UPI003D04BC60